MSQIKQTKVPSFADIAVVGRRNKMQNPFLSQINQLVDWRPISSLLNKRCLKQATSPNGAPSYPPLLLFKILLLETWYGLSDREVEERINDSISWSDFLDLGLTSASPDHSTICRFRLELVDKGIMEKLFKLFNKQLQRHGIMTIKEGAIVDASIVDSPSKPSGGRQIVIADDREDTRTDEEKAAEEAYQQQVVSTKPGVDYEARWVKKGQAYRYGYKKHTLTDSQGPVLEVITTTANVSDTTQFAPLAEKARLPEGTLILADKGYTAQKNRAALKVLQLEDGIMHKATRDKPLTASQK